jgi:ClpP class serine protease
MDTDLQESREQPDEALDKAAQGETVTSDATADGTGEIDAIGKAAGLVERADKPFRGIDEVERRDEHRWELDPASKEDEPDVD